MRTFLRHPNLAWTEPRCGKHRLPQTLLGLRSLRNGGSVIPAYRCIFSFFSTEVDEDPSQKSDGVDDDEAEKQRRDRIDPVRSLLKFEAVRFP